jgi:hypothetical protein
MSHARRSLAVISLTAAALGLGATLALAPSPHAAVLHHTVAAADAVVFSAFRPRRAVRAPLEIPQRLRRAAAPPFEGRAPHRDSGRYAVASGEKPDRAASPYLTPASFVHLAAGMPTFRDIMGILVSHIHEIASRP